MISSKRAIATAVTLATLTLAPVVAAAASAATATAPVEALLPGPHPRCPPGLYWNWLDHTCDHLPGK